MKAGSQSSVQEPLKSSLFFIYPEKPRDLLVLITRIAVVLCLVTSISLVLYVAFWTRSPYLRFPPVRRKTSIDADSGPTNISHIVFGIGASSTTWKDRRVYSSLWWEPANTRGFVWLDEDPGKNKRTVSDNNNSNSSDTYISPAPPYRVSSPEWTKFKYSSSRSAVRIARVIWDIFNLNLPNVRWFVMGDDDTVYFTENLVSVLARYDHHEMWYIGGNSESVEQDVLHAYSMAFGGGGFALSYPLAEKLVSILDGCLDRYYFFYGSDQRIWACISEIGVPLTVQPGFHQFDIRGSPYGLLAAHPVAPLVSLHHLDYLDPIFPNQTRIDSLKALMGAYRTDPPRTLQQSFCYESKRRWTFLIAWGYTIQVYPWLVRPMDLQLPLQTFKTWRSSSDGPFTFNTRPMHPDPCNRPVVYLLDQGEEVPGASGTRTFYKLAESHKSCNKLEYARIKRVKNITVSALKMAADYWHRAPHRQCCEILDHGSIEGGNLRIRIRSCRKWESVTL